MTQQANWHQTSYAVAYQFGHFSCCGHCFFYPNQRLPENIPHQIDDLLAAGL